MVYLFSFFFFFNDTATTEIYTLSLHDALPISPYALPKSATGRGSFLTDLGRILTAAITALIVTYRSEEHTSELQSRQYLVCRLLLEKKKKAEQKERQGQNVHTESL